jgi:hypothetical protein
MGGKWWSWAENCGQIISNALLRGSCRCIRKDGFWSVGIWIGHQTSNTCGKGGNKSSVVIRGKLSSIAKGHWKRRGGCQDVVRMSSSVLLSQTKAHDTYTNRSRDSDWLRTGRQRGRSSSPSMVKNFLFSTLSRPTLGVHPTSYPMGTGGSFPGGKAAGADADHSPPTSAEVK